MASILVFGVIRQVKSTSSDIWKLDDMAYFKAEQDVIRSYQSRIHGSVSHLLETGSGEEVDGMQRDITQGYYLLGCRFKALSQSRCMSLTEAVD